jgi:hypothetical protein
MAAPTSRLLPLILSADPAVRDAALVDTAEKLDDAALAAECEALHAFFTSRDNLYERVRALFFLAALYRFVWPPRLSARPPGRLPFEGYRHLLERRFGEAIEHFRQAEARDGLTDCLASGLATACAQLGLQNLANQVRRSVRSVRGNQWMFRTGHPDSHPLRLRPELLPRDGVAPILHERTAVRMDLSHSGWSDIFFLGMDFPEGARVLNVSVDLCLEGEGSPRPPVEASFRVIDEPVIRLVSIDLGCSTDITALGDIFHFAKDYLGLLKGALIAAGLVPLGMEGANESLARLLRRLLGPGRGFELVSQVNNIPKGSRLAVSTNLLGALIAVCMRATGQTESLDGPLTERERRVVLTRAILGEWLGGSGGGWQDSGGVWPGIKVITGAEATSEDPEYGVSRGRLLPTHRIIGRDEVTAETRRKLQESLVLVHGGMAQNVGPILEMVTEKYLLRSAAEWSARQESIALFDEILEALRAGDIRTLGELTTRHFYGPLQTIIPWATNAFTEALIAAVRERFGEGFWGFWMLGGMSGGGMGFIFDPAVAPEARAALGPIMRVLKNKYERALPFAMDPVVYDFRINENGSTAEYLTGEDALMPGRYYPLMLPQWVRADPRELPLLRRRELESFHARSRASSEWRPVIEGLVTNLFPSTGTGPSKDRAEDLAGLLARHGFDPVQHEKIRSDLLAGRIGLAHNRLPASTSLEDVGAADLTSLEDEADDEFVRLGRAALAAGEVAVVSLAGGAGSRWTQGAGVVKAINPFAAFAGRHRSFLELHLAKSRRTGQLHGAMPAHVFTTSYLTHAAIADFVEAHEHFGYTGGLHLSPGRSIGLRMVPMVRDLQFLWEETLQQVLDERAQKMRKSVEAALMDWARALGEAGDYRDESAPHQSLHPVGHWYEVPNLLLNGTLARLLAERPGLGTLFLHNIDTLGATLDPAHLGRHRAQGNVLTFEVISRRMQDMGGGLARVDGRVRLVEGLAMPREEDEFKLSYYNSNNCWIEIDPLLARFGLSRDDLSAPAKVARAVRDFSQRLPTYITLKDVKKRWGHGQEDIYPVAQFEKLWGDMTALPGVRCGFLAVARQRGQQLKEPGQLDGWVRDGSAAHVATLCAWD